MSKFVYLRCVTTATDTELTQILDTLMALDLYCIRLTKEKGKQMRKREFGSYQQVFVCLHSQIFVRRQSDCSKKSRSLHRSSASWPHYDNSIVVHFYHRAKEAITRAEDRLHRSRINVGDELCKLALPNPCSVSFAYECWVKGEHTPPQMPALWQMHHEMKFNSYRGRVQDAGLAKSSVARLARDIK